LKEVLFSYYTMFFHPFRGHEFLRAVRLGERESLKAPLLKLKFWDGVDPLRENTFVECMGLAWAFIIVRALYVIIGIHFGLYLYEHYDFSGEELPFIMSGSSFNMQSLTLFWLLLETVFAPIALWLFTRVWAVFIKFFTILYETEEEDIEGSITQIVNSGLCSYLCLLIPVVGSLAQFFSAQVLIFAGLKRNLKFNTLQSLLVLAAPYILVLMFMLLCLIVMGLTLVNAFSF